MLTGTGANPTLNVEFGASNDIDDIVIVQPKLSGIQTVNVEWTSGDSNDILDLKDAIGVTTVNANRITSDNVNATIQNMDSNVTALSASDATRGGNLTFDYREDNLTGNAETLNFTASNLRLSALNLVEGGDSNEDQGYFFETVNMTVANTANIDTMTVAANTREDVSAANASQTVNLVANAATEINSLSVAGAEFVNITANAAVVIAADERTANSATVALSAANDGITSTQLEKMVITGAANVMIDGVDGHFNTQQDNATASAVLDATGDAGVVVEIDASAMTGNLTLGVAAATDGEARVDSNSAVAGNDRIAIDGQDIIITSGSGNDRIETYTALAGAIRTNDGNDTVSINTGADDTNGVDDRGEVYADMEGVATIDTGAGDDTVFAANMNAIADLEAARNQTFGEAKAASIVTGEGNDTVTVQALNAARDHNNGASLLNQADDTYMNVGASIDTGAGDDVVSFTTAADGASIQMGEGSDRINVTLATAATVLQADDAAAAERNADNTTNTVGAVANLGEGSAQSANFTEVDSVTNVGGVIADASLAAFTIVGTRAELRAGAGTDDTLNVTALDNVTVAAANAVIAGFETANLTIANQIVDNNAVDNLVVNTLLNVNANDTLDTDGQINVDIARFDNALTTVNLTSQERAMELDVANEAWQAGTRTQFNVDNIRSGVTYNFSANEATGVTGTNALRDDGSFVNGDLVGTDATLNMTFAGATGAADSFTLNVGAPNAVYTNSEDVDLDLNFNANATDAGRVENVTINLTAGGSHAIDMNGFGDAQFATSAGNLGTFSQWRNINPVANQLQTTYDALPDTATAGAANNDKLDFGQGRAVSTSFTINNTVAGETLTVENLSADTISILGASNVNLEVGADGNAAYQNNYTITTGTGTDVVNMINDRVDNDDAINLGTGSRNTLVIDGSNSMGFDDNTTREDDEVWANKQNIQTLRMSVEGTDAATVVLDEEAFSTGIDTINLVDRDASALVTGDDMTLSVITGEDFVRDLAINDDVRSDQTIISVENKQDKAATNLNVSMYADDGARFTLTDTYQRVNANLTVEVNDAGVATNVASTYNAAPIGDGNVDINVTAGKLNSLTITDDSQRVVSQTVTLGAGFVAGDTVTLTVGGVDYTFVVGTAIDAGANAAVKTALETATARTLSTNLGGALNADAVMTLSTTQAGATLPTITAVSDSNTAATATVTLAASSENGAINVTVDNAWSNTTLTVTASAIDDLDGNVATGGMTFNGAAETDARLVVTGTANTDNITGGQVGDNLSGGAGNDIIDGGAGADSIDGGTGNDTIDGGTGADTIVGGEGNDQITGGLGADNLTGGAGVDTFVITAVNESIQSNADTITDFVTGTDKIAITQTVTNGSTVNLGRFAVVANSGDGDNSLDGTVGVPKKFDAYYSTSGQLAIDVDGDGDITDINDIVVNSTGAINAGDINYTITAAGGNNTVRLGQGVDTITTGAGDDTFVIVGALDAAQVAAYNAAGAGVVGGAAAVVNYNDLLSVRTASEANAGDAIFAGGGNDTLHVFGNADLSLVDMDQDNNNVSEIESIVVHSSVSMTAAQFNELVANGGRIVLDGNTPHTISITGAPAVNVNAILAVTQFVNAGTATTITLVGSNGTLVAAWDAVDGRMEVTSDSSATVAANTALQTVVAAPATVSVAVAATTIGAYHLSDTAANLAGATATVLNGAVNITATTAATVAQATTIVNATNSGTNTYALSDTAANLAGAAAAVGNGATTIGATDAATVAQATAIEAFTNSGGANTYNITDSAANLAASNNAVLTLAGTVTANTAATVAEATTLDGFAKAVVFAVSDTAANVAAAVDANLNEATGITVTGQATVAQGIAAELLTPPAVFNVTDTAAVIAGTLPTAGGYATATTITASTAATAAQAATIAGDAKAVVYSVSDTAVNLAAMAAAGGNKAVNITATTAATVVEATAIEAFTNTGTNTYNITDSAANLAASSNAVLTLAGTVTANTNATVAEGTTIKGFAKAVSFNVVDTAAAIAGSSADTNYSEAGTIIATGQATAAEAATIAGYTKAVTFNTTDSLANLSGTLSGAALTEARAVGTVTANDTNANFVTAFTTGSLSTYAQNTVEVITVSDAAALTVNASQFANFLAGSVTLGTGKALVVDGTNETVNLGTLSSYGGSGVITFGAAAGSDKYTVNLGTSGVTTINIEGTGNHDITAASSLIETFVLGDNYDSGVLIRNLESSDIVNIEGAVTNIAAMTTQVGSVGDVDTAGEWFFGAEVLTYWVGTAQQSIGLVGVTSIALNDADSFVIV